MDAFTASELLGSAWLGVAAGLAVAIPLGPIGLLIIDRGMRQGRSAGLTAAAGVASTDLVYAVLALTATAGAARIVEPITRPATLLAAAVFATIGLRGLTVRSRGAAEGDVPAGPVPTPSVRPGRTFVAFAALTAVNPATVLYFTALALALADHLHSIPTRAVFLLAVGLSSFAWQAALATLGIQLGRRPRPNVQARTRQAGSILMLALATFLASNAA